MITTDPHRSTNMKNRRRIRFIQPRLQTRLVAAFVGMTVLALLLQFLLLGMRLIPLVAELPGGAELARGLPGIMLQVIVFSLMLIVPLIFVLGVRVTHKVAGPVYRFERFLEGVARGDQVDPCKLREGDELQNLCTLVNQATETKREANARPHDHTAAAA